MSLLDGLVEFWTFNGKRLGINGSLLSRWDGGTDCFVTGRIGQAWDTAHDDGKILYTYEPTIDQSAAFSFSSWYRFTRDISLPGTDYAGLIYLRNTINGRWAEVRLNYQVEESPPSYYYVEAYCYQSYFAYWETQDGFAFDNNWHHVVCVFASNIIIYVDGIQRATGGGGIYSPINPNRCIVGGFWTVTAPDDSIDIIDSVGWWNRELSPDEVTALYNNGNGWEPTDTIYSVDGTNNVRNGGIYMRPSRKRWCKNSNTERLANKNDVEARVINKCKDVNYYDGDR